MKRITIICAIFLLIACAYAQQDPSSIRNFLRVNQQFCTGGQPKVEELESLKATGVKAIINLRTPQEFDATAEQAKAKALGLRYFNIPVVYNDPREEEATEFLKITDDPENRPAFIHCTAGIRVAAFWMIRRVLRDNWSIADAEAEAEKVGLRHTEHLRQFALNYIEHHKKK